MPTSDNNDREEGLEFGFFYGDEPGATARSLCDGACTIACLNTIVGQSARASIYRNQLLALTYEADVKDEYGDIERVDRLRVLFKEDERVDDDDIVIDDEVHIRTALSAAMSHLCDRFLEAATGREGLDVAERSVRLDRGQVAQLVQHAVEQRFGHGGKTHRRLVQRIRLRYSCRPCPFERAFF